MSEMNFGEKSPNFCLIDRDVELKNNGKGYFERIQILSKEFSKNLGFERVPNKNEWETIHNLCVKNAKKEKNSFNFWKEVETSGLSAWEFLRKKVKIYSPEDNPGDCKTGEELKELWISDFGSSQKYTKAKEEIVVEFNFNNYFLDIAFVK